MTKSAESKPKRQTFWPEDHENEPYRVYADGREFGIDYPTAQAAFRVAIAYKFEHPMIKYEVRQSGRFVGSI
jgi:hypothetical protein